MYSKISSSIIIIALVLLGKYLECLRNGAHVDRHGWLEAVLTKEETYHIRNGGLPIGRPKAKPINTNIIYFYLLFI